MIERRKAAGRDEIPPELLKMSLFNDITFRLWNDVYIENTIKKWMKICILPFRKKSDLEIIMI